VFAKRGYIAQLSSTTRRFPLLIRSCQTHVRAHPRLRNLRATRATARHTGRLLLGLLTAALIVGALPSFAYAAPPSSITLEADSTSVSPGDMIRLTATASSSVDATGYRIQILNADTGTVITNCGGTVCKGAEPVAWSENANPLEHHYLARVRDYADTDTAASSSQVTVTVRPYDFAPVLTAERYSVAPRNLIRLSATTSRSVDGTGYRIQIVNTDTGSVVTNCGGSSCSGAEWVEWAENANPGQHHYLARVQTYGGDDTAGTSGPITVNVHQQRFGLALSVSSTTGSDGAKRYTVTATSDRSVDATG
jgi:hypothetical protein